MTIFEPSVLKEILSITCTILKKNFFYEQEEVIFFLQTFAEEFSSDIVAFERLADKNVLDELDASHLARIHFTCYIVSAHLRDIFIHDLHFSEQELEAFDSIIPKYAGENRNEYKSRKQRKNDRKFPE